MNLFLAIMVADSMEIPHITSMGTKATKTATKERGLVTMNVIYIDVPRMTTAIAIVPDMVMIEVEGKCCISTVLLHDWLWLTVSRVFDLKDRLVVCVFDMRNKSVDAS